MYLWKQRSLIDHVPFQGQAGLSRALGLAGLVAAILAAAGLSFALLSTRFARHESRRSERTPPTIGLCELLANPKAYDLQIIKVTATVTVNDGDRSLYDPACITMEPMVGVVADPSLKYDPSAGIPKQFFDVIQSGKQSNSSGTRMTLVGRFQGPNFPKDGRMSRFQHQLVVIGLEKAESPGVDSITSDYESFLAQVRNAAAESHLNNLKDVSFAESQKEGRLWVGFDPTYAKAFVLTQINGEQTATLVSPAVTGRGPQRHVVVRKIRLPAPKSGWPAFDEYLERQGFFTPTSFKLDQGYKHDPDGKYIVLEARLGNSYGLAFFGVRTESQDGRRLMEVCRRTQDEFGIWLGCH